MLHGAVRRQKLVSSTGEQWRLRVHGHETWISLTGQQGNEICKEYIGDPEAEAMMEEDRMKLASLATPTNTQAMVRRRTHVCPPLCI